MNDARMSKGSLRCFPFGRPWSRLAWRRRTRSRQRSRPRATQRLCLRRIPFRQAPSPSATTEKVHTPVWLRGRAHVDSMPILHTEYNPWSAGRVLICLSLRRNSRGLARLVVRVL